MNEIEMAEYTHGYAEAKARIKRLESDYPKAAVRQRILDVLAGGSEDPWSKGFDQACRDYLGGAA